MAGLLSRLADYKPSPEPSARPRKRGLLAGFGEPASYRPAEPAPHWDFGDGPVTEEEWQRQLLDAGALAGTPVARSPVAPYLAPGRVAPGASQAGPRFDNTPHVGWEKPTPAPAGNWYDGVADYAGKSGRAAGAIWDDPGGAADALSEVVLDNWIKPAGDAVSAPYRALTKGLADPEAEAFNMAGWLMGGGIAAPKPRGSIGSAGGKLPAELPMDLDSRMARAKEMGFNLTPVYHGTGWDFPAFDPAAKGKVTHSRAAEEAIFSTPDPALANEFAGMSEKAGGAPQVMPLLLRPGNKARLTLDGSEMGHEIAATLNNAFETGGLDTIALDNYLYPNSTYDSQRQGRVFAAKSPNQYRSVHAAFDPAKKHSSDLLAAGHPLAPALTPWWEED